MSKNQSNLFTTLLVSAGALFLFKKKQSKVAGIGSLYTKYDDAVLIISSHIKKQQDFSLVRIWRNGKYNYLLMTNFMGHGNSKTFWLTENTANKLVENGIAEMKDLK